MKFETQVNLEKLAEAGEFDTLGDLSYILDLLKERGWTRESVEYVIYRVFWE